MGLITRLLSFRHGDLNSEVVVDPGGGATFTAPHMSDPGDDSAPLPDDYCVSVDTQSSGGEAVVGYVDTTNARKSQPGDKRIYARSTGGGQVSEIWLKNDGSVMVVSNGAIDINGVTVSPSGAMTVPASLVVNGIELATHTHDTGTYRDAEMRPLRDGDAGAPE